MRFCGLVLLVPLVAMGQDAVRIDVDARSRTGKLPPIWSYFGYDEPNYTYMPNGAKLIGELGALHRSVYIRTHNLLTTGDGTPALKWGSTNAYREDAEGKPVYDWTIVDRIIDTYLKAKAKPFVEIGFMPEALSTKPEPYRHAWPQTKIAAGWAYPPKDYQKWGDLVYEWVRHAVVKYGEAEVNSWYWEVWNEPDIEYWQGTPAEYDKLYDVTVAGVKRAAPRARVGGPASTGPANAKAAAFLRQFLEHCDRLGTPLDFISYHAKGRPTVVDGHVQMGLGNELRDVAAGMDIVGSFAKFRDLPIVLSEADPEGCAACSARTAPQNAYRNGALYAAYTAAAMNSLLELAAEHRARLEGMLTWAFEFEGQPYFDGFRTLATNGVDQPVMNFFRMAAMLEGERAAVKSTGRVKTSSIMEAGVRGTPAVDAIATAGHHNLSVMVWNYHDADVAGPDAPVVLRFLGLPAGAKSASFAHYRVDRDHSNAFTVWKEMGSPQQPTPEQQAALEKRGGLEMLDATGVRSIRGESLEYAFTLPRQGVSLIRLTW